MYTSLLLTIPFLLSVSASASPVSPGADLAERQITNPKVLAGAPVSDINVKADNLVQCGQSTISWTGAVPPYSLQINTGGLYLPSTTLETHPGLKEASYGWKVTQGEGVGMYFQVTDANGAVGYVQNIYVAGSDDSSCLSGGASSSSSAPSSSSQAQAPAQSAPAPSSSAPTAETPTAAAGGEVVTITSTSRAVPAPQATSASAVAAGGDDGVVTQTVSAVPVAQSSAAGAESASAGGDADAAAASSSSAAIPVTTLTAGAASSSNSAAQAQASNSSGTQVSTAVVSASVQTQTPSNGAGRVGPAFGGVLAAIVVLGMGLMI